MMKMYYLNKIVHSADAQETCEIHCDGCREYHAPENKELLGMFKTTEEAMKESLKRYRNVIVCYDCCLGVSPKQTH